MTDVHQKKAVNNGNTMNTIVAGIAGAVAGGAAVATAMVMSDKKNQKKVSNALAGAKEKVTQFIDTVKSQPIVEKSTHKVEEVAADVKQKVAVKV
ncbi:MAG TPA: hypothetical protein VMR81_02675 [Patescibacteria group bacterium]|jgi:hypothetical protein|nr:hypothetical protein [Patescibacteria group bacterium]